MRFLPGILIVASAGLGFSAERPLMRDFIGINGHTVQFRPELYRPVASHVRDYHPVQWDLAEETAKLPEFPLAKNKVDWSRIYGDWSRDGWTIDVCLMFESVPREKWSDIASDAGAYGEAFARMFGPGGRHPFVETVEIGNEPGKWSDGDFRTMAGAMARGVRAGNARLKIATCNLTTGDSGDYDKSVKCLDGMLDLFDVLTIHTYPTVEGWPTWRRSYPEDPALKDYLPSVERLCEWRDRNAPGKPVWITEFGYDASTKPPPAEGTFSKWEDVSDEQQAQWLVRSLLLFSAMPVERAYIYFFNDADTPQFHGSSGLTRNFEPKPAYYAVSHFQSVLGGYRFSRIVKKTDRLCVYEFENDRSVAWAVWSPTGDGTEFEETLEDLPGSVETIVRMPLSEDAGPARGGSGGRKPVTLNLEVGESPTYVIFNR